MLLFYVQFLENISTASLLKKNDETKMFSKVFNNGFTKKASCQYSILVAHGH